MSLRADDLSIDPNGTSLILLRKSKTDQKREGVLLALDRKATLAITAWLEVVAIADGYLLRGIAGDRIKKSMDSGQVSRTFKSHALKAGIDPANVNGHSTRIGAAQDMLLGGASIGQIMAKVGWSKVDTVMRYVGVGDVTALNSVARISNLTLIRPDHSVDCLGPR